MCTRFSLDDINKFSRVRTSSSLYAACVCVDLACDTLSGFVAATNSIHTSRLQRCLIKMLSKRPMKHGNWAKFRFTNLFPSKRIHSIFYECFLLDHQRNRSFIFATDKTMLWAAIKMLHSVLGGNFSSTLNFQGILSMIELEVRDILLESKYL